MSLAAVVRRSSDDMGRKTSMESSGIGSRFFCRYAGPVIVFSFHVAVRYSGGTWSFCRMRVSRSVNCGRSSTLSVCNRSVVCVGLMSGTSLGGVGSGVLCGGSDGVSAVRAAFRSLNCAGLKTFSGSKFVPFGVSAASVAPG